MKGIAILGATGSIGLNTIDVVLRHPERFQIVALAAHRNVESMAELCRHVRPRYAVMAAPDAAQALRAALADLRPAPEILAGAAALETIAALPEVDYLMAAIVGAAGLMSTLTAARAGKRVLLANKEALVVAGALLMRTVAEHGAELLPIDSEHNAIFQCLPPTHRAGLERVGVARILLTASGGPFRAAAPETLAQVTPAQACAHPNWRMGRKISVDSATMMNKGLELIEACWLFDTRPEHIQVVVHPQSVIHSLVQYIDGSVLAQLGNPDMRTPIAHALAWPERIAAGVAPLDLFAIGRLDFEPPAFDRFPCLRLAYEAATAGGTAPAILNATNEVAVAAFLEEKIGFADIPRVVGTALDRLPVAPVTDLAQVLEVDGRARALAQDLIANLV